MGAARRVVVEARAAHPGARICAAPVPLELSSASSVCAFARSWGLRPLHLLVNCAGAQVGDLAGVNHLGPYLLTRLLERRLVASRPSRVVFVSSVTHRHADWTELERWAAEVERRGDEWRGEREAYPSGLPELSYASTKLANALTAFELARRLDARQNVAMPNQDTFKKALRAASPPSRDVPVAVASPPLSWVDVAAVDPGVAMTGIWKSPSYSRGAAKRLLDLVGDTPESAARSVLHVCAAPDWAADRRPARLAAERALGGAQSAGASSAFAMDEDGASTQENSPTPPDLRMYARGMFGAFPTTLRLAYPPLAVPGWSPRWARLAATPAFLLDTWARRALGVGAETHVVPAAPAAYDPELARRIWEASAHAVGLSPEIDVEDATADGSGSDQAAAYEDWFAEQSTAEEVHADSQKA